MRFSFPLQTLLNWKRNLEEFSQMRLAAKITRLKNQDEEIQELVLKRLSYEEELNWRFGKASARMNILSTKGLRKIAGKIS